MANEGAAARAAALALAVLLALSCGGEHAPAAPRPVAAVSGPRQAVSGVVGYDEDGDGRLGGDERTRLAGVTVRVGDRTGTTDGTGRFEIADAPPGHVTAVAEVATLPPYFEAPAVQAALPPAPGTLLEVPVTLPIGANRRHTYAAFGDSISAGVGSSRGDGYREALAGRLRALWGRGEVLDEGVSGSGSGLGVARLGATLAAARPAWLLVHYGTNDYTPECRNDGACPTVENLRAIVRQARAAGSLPVLATLLPLPAVEDPFTEARAAWIEEVNGGIRDLARAEGVPLADTGAAFKADRDVARLFADPLHPSDRGYDLMAEVFFQAVTRPRR